MQFWIHVVLVVLAMAYFLYSFIKEKKVYQLLFVIWIPLTLLTYLSKNKAYLIILGIVQLIFFFLVIFFLFRNPNKKKGGFQSMLDELDSYGNAEDAEEDAAGGLSEADVIAPESASEAADDEEEI